MNIALPVLATIANVAAMWFYGRKQTKIAPAFAFLNAGLLILANVLAGQPWMCVPPLANIVINLYNLYRARKESRG